MIDFTNENELTDPIRQFNVLKFRFPQNLEGS